MKQGNFQISREETTLIIRIEFPLDVLMLLPVIAEPEKEDPLMPIKQARRYTRSDILP